MNLTGLSPEQIAQIMHQDSVNSQVKNQTVANAFGMYDKQQDNLRADAQQQIMLKLKQQEYQLKQMEATAMAEKRYADVMKIQEELKLLPLKAQQLIASAGSLNASAANARDQIGTHGKAFTTITNPENGQAESALVDLKTGMPISTFGPATPKQTGIRDKVISESVMQKAFEDLKKSTSTISKEGDVTFHTKIDPLAVQKYNDVAAKTGSPLKKIIPVKVPNKYFPGSEDVDLVVDENATLRELRDQLVNNHDYSEAQAEAALAPFRR